jgi:hypothetical protein
MMLSNRMAREAEVRLRDFTNKKYFRQPRGSNILAHCLKGSKMRFTLTNIAIAPEKERLTGSTSVSRPISLRARNVIETATTGDDSLTAAQLNECEAR